MRTGRPIPPLKITAAEREMLERWARGHDRRLASRASAVLASADGVSNKDVAARCAMTYEYNFPFPLAVNHSTSLDEQLGQNGRGKK